MTLPNPDLAAHSDSITLQTGAEEVPLELTGYTEYRAFPPPSVLLADPDLETTLRTLGFGYRAKFIASSLELLVSEHGSEALGEGRNGTHDNRGINDFLHRMGLPEEGLEVGQWRVEMIRLKGVGRKVADCIGLLSLNQVSGGSYGETRIT
jgi:N-glycosylase/DNA lyase